MNPHPRDAEFIQEAINQKQLSNDPNFQVGACVVNQNYEIIGRGYNCMPRNLDNDNVFTWSKKGDLNNKHYYVCHAELNAIAEANRNGNSVANCTIYSTLYPCNECAKFIVQAGIREVVYLSNEKRFKNQYIAARFIFDAVDIICRKPMSTTRTQDERKKNDRGREIIQEI